MPGQKDRTYTIFQKGTEQAGGMMSATPEMHLTTSVLDDLLRGRRHGQVRCQGGAARCQRSLMKPTDIPTIGRFAVIKDPQGAWFSILKPQI